MALDLKYICASDLELYLVDKTTGEPLSGGIVTFYSDNNRAQLKPIYTISGSPPNYSFVQLPNPSTLSASGTFQDAGNNNVVPYYYPYDSDGNTELYYITVESSGNTPQLDREAWPPNVGETSSDTAANAVNYIPNGQFVTHNDVPANFITDIPFGQITQDETEIAQGGWYFNVPPGSSSVNNVQFFRFGEYVTNPSASPRYAVQIVCSTASGSDVFKDLRIRFEDVNKFASDTDVYTFGFSGTTFNSGDFNVSLNVIKNFGTGGSPSPTTVETVATFSIDGNQRFFQTSFDFGNNNGKNIGTNDDDYVELAISFPTNITFGGQFTDFVLFFGDVIIGGFPPTTTRDVMARSGTPPVPNPEGYDLYLPIISTKEGSTYDDSGIGSLVPVQYDFPTSISPTTNLLLANGAQYFTDGYSPLGIPYARLHSRYFNTIIGQPIFGTGANFVSTAIQTSSTSNLFMSTNSFGSAVNPVDVSTGFTFFDVKDFNATSYGLASYQQSSTTLFIRATVAGFVTSPTFNTSGFTINVYRNPSSVNAYLMFTLTTIAATTLAGKYFSFTSLNPTSTNYYMWFTVDGAGADPAPGGTGIKVDLKSTYTAADVALIVNNAIMGRQLSVITTVAASTMSPGDYFTFGATGVNNYYVWYTIDTSGTQPFIPGSLGIKVDLVTADTAPIVASKTKLTINRIYFAVPDLRGMFLRGYDPLQEWDLGTRFGVTPDQYGNVLGTFEADNLVAHSHVASNINNAQEKPFQSGSPAPVSWATVSNETGGNENRSVNANVNWLIRY